MAESLPTGACIHLWRCLARTLTPATPSTPAEHSPLDVQEAEETFDLALIAALEIDVVPYLGDARVPDHIVRQLATVLQRGSRIRDEEDYRPPSPLSPGGTANANAHGANGAAAYGFEKIERIGDVPAVEGSTEPGRFVPRERFSFWCFDLLFIICSDAAKGMA